MAVPPVDLAAVGARELRVHSLAFVETLDLGDGRAAVDLGADRAFGRGREWIGQTEELLARLFGRRKRPARPVTVEPPFPRRAPVLAVRPRLDLEDRLGPRGLAALPTAAAGEDDQDHH